EADLTHLASACADNVQSTLDEVLADVAELERDGVTPDARVICGDDGDDEIEGRESNVEGQESRVESRESGEQYARRTLSAEEAIAALRAKIDRLGPVNMMAIEQFDELETRHAF